MRTFLPEKPGINLRRFLEKLTELRNQINDDDKEKKTLTAFEDNEPHWEFPKESQQW